MSTRKRTEKVESTVEVEETVCDKCGAAGREGQEGPFGHGGFVVRTDGWVMGIDGCAGGVPVRTYDLCPKCMSKLEAWFRRAR